jgi:hypothetical protein
MENYIEKLLQQGQGNLNICPDCFQRGERKPYCTNMVVLLPENVMVCCYLGDKHEITRKEFRKNVRDMTKKSKK